MKHPVKQIDSELYVLQNVLDRLKEEWKENQDNNYDTGLWHAIEVVQEMMKEKE